VLLVQQQGPGGVAPIWTLPGGRVAADESLLDALNRVVEEGTGLTVEQQGRLIYLTDVDHAGTPAQPPEDSPEAGDRVTTYVFEIEAVSGELRPRNAGGTLFGIGYFSRSDAIERLERVPSRTLREPPVAALRGEAVAGSVWSYRIESAGEALVGRMPPPRDEVPAQEPTEPLTPRQERQHEALVLGCMAIAVVFVIIVILGIVTLAHPHF
jgi:ADP-ribose pyrophosphatase YjhB (NUDIX family)